MRLDELLVERGLCPTRNRAKALIMAGKVRRKTEILDKPGKTYPFDIVLELLKPPPFVSRGGGKLEAFLSRFEVSAKGRNVLDVGASTGGFTDCLLQRGARRVVCVDVGRNQLHERLRRDERVCNLEKRNARYLKPEDLPLPSYSLIVMDLSFISLTKVLPAVWPLLEEKGCLIMLIKPQFEARKKEADKGSGVIRDPAIHKRVVAEIRAFNGNFLTGAEEFGFMESPLKGADGNAEFLLGLVKRRAITTWNRKWKIANEK